MSIQTPEFWVALPDSLLDEAVSLRDKTFKAGTVARSCSIFRVKRIYIYNEDKGKFAKEGRLLKTLLEFMETPQYLRKRLFKRAPELQFAGTLPPLRTPHHKDIVSDGEVRTGDTREGVVVRIKGGDYVDAGLSRLVPLKGLARDGQRVTVRFTSGAPAPQCEIVRTSEVEDYWGYQVRVAPALGRFVKSANCDVVFLTSVKGVDLRTISAEVAKKLRSSSTVLLVFGSPSRGIGEILAKENIAPERISDFVLNFVPGQGVATVRTDEAVLIALATLHLMRLE